MIKLFNTLLILIMSVAIYGQSASESIFNANDKIWIETAGGTEYYYIHEIKKGHSLYGLSKIFDVPLKLLSKLNNLKDGSTIGIGQRIKVPFRDDYLFKGISLDGLSYGHYIPVYYQAKPKDNLFRISRIYFDQPTENLRERNKLTNSNLALGQDILIGWLPIDNSTPLLQNDEFEEDLSKVQTDPLPENTNSYKVGFEEDLEEDIEYEELLEIEDCPLDFNTSLLGALTYSSKMKEIKVSEVANWDKTMPDNGTVYVLHSHAIIDSYIEMYNPNTKRNVRAKVIGRIPFGAYTSDISLVLSPRTAKQLGALDNRFKVEIKALVLETE